MIRRILPFLSMTLVVAMLCACNMSIDKNPAFVALNKKVAELEKAQKQTQSTVESINVQLENLTTEIKNLKSQTASVPQNILDQIASLEQRVTDLTQKAAAAPAKPAAKAKADEASNDEAAAPQAKATNKEPRREDTKAKGSYYTVKAGDTIASVAKAQGVTPGSISKANHIPATAKLIPGQTIFIVK